MPQLPMEGGCHHQEITDVLVIWHEDPHISPSTVEDEWKPLKSQDSRGTRCLPSHQSGTTSQSRRVTPHKSPFLPPPPTIGDLVSFKPHYHFPNARASLLPGRRNEAIRLPSATAIIHRLPVASALTLALQRSSGATSSSCACDCVPSHDNQHFARMFTKALWGHIHSMLLPRSTVANVDPPPPSSDTANVDPLSLVGGFPRAGGGSPADSQPPPPSLPPPSVDANVDPS
jgi:hypothetical protein